MTATEELRRLLDERGVKYRWDNGTATWCVDGVMYNAWGYDNERLTMSVCHLTPEQAIAATLGPGTCYAIDSGYATAFCSVCGAEFMGSIMTNEPPDYVKPLACCPECGRRIIKSNGKADD